MNETEGEEEGGRDISEGYPAWFREEVEEGKRRDEARLAAHGKRVKQHRIKITALGFALSFFAGILAQPAHALFLIVAPVCGAVSAYLIAHMQWGYFAGAPVFTLPQLVLAVGGMKVMRVEVTPLGAPVMIFGWLLLILFGILITYLADTGRWVTG